MVNIVTGPIDSGKTSKILQFYNETKHGYGYITKKIFQNGTNIGQRIINLSTGEDKLFSLKINFIQPNWDEIYRYIDYSFSQGGINFAENIINEAINSKSGPIFIDEIGPLEIYKKQGLFNSISKLLISKRELFVVIRNSCLEDFIRKFQLKKYTLL